MEDSGCSAILCNLLCHEDGTSLEGGEEEEEERGADEVGLTRDSAISEEEEEYIGTLVSRENSFEGRNSGCFSSSDASSGVPAVDWLKYARSAAVRWILRVGSPRPRLSSFLFFICFPIFSISESSRLLNQTRAYFGFSPQTAYLSVIYLDRFFVKRTIDVHVSLHFHKRFLWPLCSVALN